MLSYRHAFHAGNHADVLKHLLLVHLLRYLAQKDKPFTVIDTHAGAGVYALDRGYATQLAEYETGIGRLWSRPDLPAPVADYVALVRNLNGDGPLRRYPGSPWLTQQCLRAQDRLHLFELHPSDSALLAENFRSAGRQVQVQAGDGFAALKALLPPPARRGLVLIDPSYETRDDYARVLQALKDGLSRFANGVFAVWYPQLMRKEAKQLPKRLKQALKGDWLDVALTVRTPAPDGFGMFGSGMFIVNPPWTLPQTLSQALPWLVEALGQDAGATYRLEYEIA